MTGPHPASDSQCLRGSLPDPALRPEPWSPLSLSALSPGEHLPDHTVPGHPRCLSLCPCVHRASQSVQWSSPGEMCVGHTVLIAWLYGGTGVLRAEVVLQGTLASACCPAALGQPPPELASRSGPQCQQEPTMLPPVLCEGGPTLHPSPFPAQGRKQRATPSGWAQVKGAASPHWELVPGGRLALFGSGRRGCRELHWGVSQAGGGAGSRAAGGTGQFSSWSWSGAGGWQVQRGGDGRWGPTWSGHVPGCLTRCLWQGTGAGCLGLGTGEPGPLALSLETGFSLRSQNHGVSEG